MSALPKATLCRIALLENDSNVALLDRAQRVALLVMRMGADLPRFTLGCDEDSVELSWEDLLLCVEFEPDDKVNIFAQSRDDVRGKTWYPMYDNDDDLASHIMSVFIRQKKHRDDGDFHIVDLDKKMALLSTLDQALLDDTV